MGALRSRARARPGCRHSGRTPARSRSPGIRARSRTWPGTSSSTARRPARTRTRWGSPTRRPRPFPAWPAVSCTTSSCGRTRRLTCWACPRTRSWPVPRTRRPNSQDPGRRPATRARRSASTSRLFASDADGDPLRYEATGLPRRPVHPPHHRPHQWDAVLFCRRHPHGHRDGVRWVCAGRPDGQPEFYLDGDQRERAAGGDPDPGSDRSGEHADHARGDGERSRRRQPDLHRRRTAGGVVHPPDDRRDQRNAVVRKRRDAPRSP